ncbi:MAG: PD-(D/E)XK nuclease family protein [Gemmatimonas sp.]|nr:PD-(D/E)XK nuclease family protein [Gemmatimonas sp.]
MTALAPISAAIDSTRSFTGGHACDTSPSAPPTPCPSFAWSYSRAALLDRCERLYYEHYYGSHGGWSAEASPRTRLAFRLKHLTTPTAELGRAVHRRAAEIALAVRDGAPQPTAATLQAKTYAELEAVIMRGINDPAWIANPRRAPVLHEVYYGGMGFARRRKLLAAMNDRASVLHSTLLASPVWNAAAIPGADILFIDESILITLDGVSTIATPDLVLQLPPDRLIIVDWKTGNTGDISQLILYANAVQAALGARYTTKRCEAWMVHLDRTSLEATTVTPAKVEAAAAARRASVTRMEDLLDDPTHNVPRQRAAFRQATDPNQGCRRCKMLAMCSTEFAGAKAA